MSPQEMQQKVEEAKKNDRMEVDFDHENNRVTIIEKDENGDVVEVTVYSIPEGDFPLEKKSGEPNALADWTTVRRAIKHGTVVGVGRIDGVSVVRIRQQDGRIVEYRLDPNDSRSVALFDQLERAFADRRESSKSFMDRHAGGPVGVENMFDGRKNVPPDYEFAEKGSAINPVAAGIAAAGGAATGDERMTEIGARNSAQHAALGGAGPVIGGAAKAAKGKADKGGGFFSKVVDGVKGALNRLRGKR